MKRHITHIHKSLYNVQRIPIKVNYPKLTKCWTLVFEKDLYTRI